MVQTGEVGVMENLTQRRKEEEGDESPYYGDCWGFALTWIRRTA